MFTKKQIEARALDIYDAVRIGSGVEDSLVELKGDWPEPYKAARRIAAHANAARGESIIWLIGLDEKSGYCSSKKVEISEWWKQVQSYFDGLSPLLYDIIVHTDDGPLQVLHFDTSQSPFVVKNPLYGQKGAGPVEREVPWREGTSVRTAKREDLIRMLMPITALPEVEILSAMVTLKTQKPVDESWEPEIISVKKSEHFEWYVYMALYIVPQARPPIVFPTHKTKVGIKYNSDTNSAVFAQAIRYSKPGWSTPQGFKADTASVQTTSAEAIIHLPGQVNLTAYIYEPVSKLPNIIKSLKLNFSVQPIGTEHAVAKEVELPFIDEDSAKQWKWGVDKLTPEG